MSLFSRPLFAALLLLSANLSVAQDEVDSTDIDLPSMYQQIDEAIKASPKFIDAYETKLRKSEDALASTKDPEQRLLLMMELCEMYSSFNGDSTLAYANRSLKQAQELGLPNVVAHCQTRLAYLCTSLGSQTEALTLLSRINRPDLEDQDVIDYYLVHMLVYENLANNCQIETLRNEFWGKYGQFEDSLLSSSASDMEMHDRYLERRLLMDGNIDRALVINDNRLRGCASNSRLEAIVANGRYDIYMKKGDEQMAIYWLCRSALDDIRNAVMDQSSLITLVDLLEKIGETERAARYITFTWECNRKYSPHMRLWQIAPLQSAIEKHYEALLHQKNSLLTKGAIGIALVSILLIGLILFLRFRNRRLNQNLTVHTDDNDRLIKENENLKKKIQILETLHR